LKELGRMAQKIAEASFEKLKIDICEELVLLLYGCFSYLLLTSKFAVGFGTRFSQVYLPG